MTRPATSLPTSASIRPFSTKSLWFAIRGTTWNAAGKWPKWIPFFSTLLFTLNSCYVCACLQISRCWKLCQLSPLHRSAALRHSPGRLHHSVSAGGDEEPGRGSANYRHQDHAGLWQETVPGLIRSSATNRISTLPTIFRLFTKFNCETSQSNKWVASVPRCLTFCFAPVELTEINRPRLQKSSRSIPGNNANSVMRDISVNEYIRICQNKRPPRNKRPPKTVIFQRGEYTKPKECNGWFFKGGSTQNRWALMGFEDFSLLLKLSVRGVYSGKYDTCEICHYRKKIKLLLLQTVRFAHLFFSFTLFKSNAVRLDRNTIYFLMEFKQISQVHIFHKLLFKTLSVVQIIS